MIPVLDLSFKITDTELRVTKEFAALLSQALGGVEAEPGMVFALGSAEFGLKSGLP
ncbi:hypothetical protein [Streptomyces sp. TLI_146]|uniref:hypothetical protein n=1 Tax=Streptomyces sp. TLI_146 TaxID=1938858 RepID=UPI000CA9E710|nr:hypothetical protein [Streptomyces sp. TLI_146]PKV82926.1 hypothetical protein BX283_0399 [Streptomyces sp. TLI_146]